MKLSTIVFLSFFSFAFSLNANAQVQFIAHRGGSYVAPENTLASAKLGWKLGADAVEVDIHLSKDNRIMVIHDSNTKRDRTIKFRKPILMFYVNWMPVH